MCPMNRSESRIETSLHQLRAWYGSGLWDPEHLFERLPHV